MTRTQQWIARLEAGERIDWRKEELLLALELLRGGERFVHTLVERDTQADDHYQQHLGGGELAR